MIAKTTLSLILRRDLLEKKRQDLTDYSNTVIRMIQLASELPGFLGFGSTGKEFAITISYWERLGAIKNWKVKSEHMIAQQRGIK